MRAMLIDDRWPTLTRGDDPQHFTNIRPARAACKLSVPERPGAPFTEQVIALRIQCSARFKLAHVTTASAYLFASFENQGQISVHCHQPRGKETRRPGTNYSGTVYQTAL